LLLPSGDNSYNSRISHLSHLCTHGRHSCSHNLGTTVPTVRLVPRVTLYPRETLLLLPAWNTYHNSRISHLSHLCTHGRNYLGTTVPTVRLVPIVTLYPWEALLLSQPRNNNHNCPISPYSHLVPVVIQTLDFPPTVCYTLHQHKRTTNRKKSNDGESKRTSSAQGERVTDCKPFCANYPLKFTPELAAEPLFYVLSRSSRQPRHRPRYRTNRVECGPFSFLIDRRRN
jgi:hypothetical protein